VKDLRNDENDRDRKVTRKIQREQKRKQRIIKSTHKNKNYKKKMEELPRRKKERSG
jgi:hypothetical protein